MNNKLWSVMLVCAMAFVSVSADAARMGGGKSVGRKSSNVTQREAAPSAPINTAAPAQSANPSAAAAKPGADARGIRLDARKGDGTGKQNRHQFLHGVSSRALLVQHLIPTCRATTPPVML